MGKGCDVASCMITLLRVTSRFESFVEIYPLIISLEIVELISKVSSVMYS